jgi:transposase
MRYPDGGGLTARGRSRREQVRLQAAQMFAQHADARQIARSLRVSTTSVYLWRRTWRAGGKAGLASKGPGPSGCKLDRDQMARLAAALDAGPAAYSWDQDQGWTLARAAALITRLFGAALVPGLGSHRGQDPDLGAGRRRPARIHPARSHPSCGLDPRAERSGSGSANAASGRAAPPTARAGPRLASGQMVIPRIVTPRPSSRLHVRRQQFSSAPPYRWCVRTNVGYSDILQTTDPSYQNGRWSVKAPQ